MNVAVAVTAPDAQEVLDVRHWDERLFSFRVTRPPTLRFRAGEFVMIGLPASDGRPLMRAYSIASPVWDDALEFYSIKAPGGALTERLQRIRPGDRVIVRPRPTGTLVLDALRPGRRLWMISTGTGVAPFACLVRDPDVHARFERVILTQTCRRVSELAYGAALAEALPQDPLVGDRAGAFLRIASTTREPSPLMGRITDLIASGALFDLAGTGKFDPEADRVMICGSVDLNRDVAALLRGAGMVEGANNRPGDYVVEKAFVG